MVAAYTCKRKINRWPMAIFANILDVSALNAFVLWRETNPSGTEEKTSNGDCSWKTLGELWCLYLYKQVCSLDSSFSLMVQTQNPFTRDLPDPSTAPGLERKRCHYCGPKDNKTSMVCVQCKTFTCNHMLPSLLSAKFVRMHKAHGYECLFIPNRHNVKLMSNTDVS